MLRAQGVCPYECQPKPHRPTKSGRRAPGAPRTAGTRVMSLPLLAYNARPLSRHLFRSPLKPPGKPVSTLSHMKAPEISLFCAGRGGAQR